MKGISLLLTFFKPHNKIILFFKKSYNITLDKKYIRVKGNKIKIILSEKISPEQEKELKENFKYYDITLVFYQIPSPISQPNNIIGKHGKNKSIDRSNIKKIIAIASGKGGVGKSTISLNIARALARSGLKTALVDADIHGPSIPVMTGGYQKANFTNNKISPIERDGIKIMSIGYMIDPAKPVIWRGPMLSGALEQMFEQVAWGDIDIMIIDMPPGTGDIQLTLCQSITPDGAVIISTPQITSVIDAERCANMFEKLNIPITGVIENMSGFEDNNTGKIHYIFGKDGAKEFAKTYNYPFLGSLPIIADIPYLTDNGICLKQKETTSKAANIFDSWAKELA